MSSLLKNRFFPELEVLEDRSVPSVVGSVGLPIITATQGAALAKMGQMQGKPDGLPIITSGQVGNSGNTNFGQTAAHSDHAMLDSYFAAPPHVGDWVFPNMHR